MLKLVTGDVRSVLEGLSQQTQHVEALESERQSLCQKHDTLSLTHDALVREDVRAQRGLEAAQAQILQGRELLATHVKSWRGQAAALTNVMEMITLSLQDAHSLSSAFDLMCQHLKELQMQLEWSHTQTRVTA